MLDDSALSRLKQAVIHQKTAVFPPPPENPALEPLYERLLAYDRRISGAVIQAIQGLSLNPADLEPDNELDQLLDTQGQADQGPKRAALKHYRSLKNRTDETRALVLQAMNEKEG